MAFGATLRKFFHLRRDPIAMDASAPQSSPSELASAYERCDPAYLRQWYERQEIDESTLARTACLSLAQVRQLLQGGDSLFYSAAAKRQAYRRLMLLLGADPPYAEGFEPPPQTTGNKPTGSQALAQIADFTDTHQYLEHQPVADFFRDLRLRIQHQYQALLALGFLVFALVLLVFNDVLEVPDWSQLDVVASVSPAPAPPPNPISPAPVAPAAAQMASAAVAPASALVSTTQPEVATPAASAGQVPLAPAPMASASAPVQAALPASAPASASMTAAAVKTSGLCGHVEHALPVLEPASATKDGKFVFFNPLADVTVCAVDANRQAILLALRAGEGRSVYGVPPWQISGADPAKVQVFFQGRRIALPEPAPPRFVLQAVRLTP